MCGIYAVVSLSPVPASATDLQHRLRNRGPDHQGTAHAQLQGLFLSFTATVLSLRGDHVTAQPLVDQTSGSVLCWNGEAWKIRGLPVAGNDGEAVMSMLTEARHHGSAHDHFLDVLREVQGPFAFIYFDKPANRLYYGRDRLGRRSLLFKAGEQFAISSIADAPTEGWAEVEADGCYSLHLDSIGSVTDLVPLKHNWTDDEELVSGHHVVECGPNFATYFFRSRALEFSTLLFLKSPQG